MSRVTKVSKKPKKETVDSVESCESFLKSTHKYDITMRRVEDNSLVMLKSVPKDKIINYLNKL
jgi:hypothetical protein